MSAVLATIGRLVNAADRGAVAEYYAARHALGMLVAQRTNASGYANWSARTYDQAIQAYLAHRHEEAISLWHRLAVAQRALAPRSRDTVLVLNALGMAYRRAYRPEMARAYAREALAIAEGQEKLRLHAVESCGNLGTVAADQRRYEEAREWYQRGLGLLDPERDPPEMVANFYGNLGSCYRDTGNEEMAIRWYRAAFNLLINRDAVRGWVLRAAGNLAFAQRGAGDLRGAEATLLSQLHAPPSDEDQASWLLLRYELAQVYMARRQWNRAQASLEAVIEIWRREEFDEDDLGRMLATLTYANLQTGELDQARNNGDEAWEIYRRVAPGGLGEAAAAAAFGVAYSRRERLTAEEYRHTRALLRHALRLMRSLGSSQGMAQTLSAWALVERTAGHYGRARVLSYRAAAMEAELTPLHPDRLTTYRGLARTLYTLKRESELLPVLREAQTAAEQILAGTIYEMDRLSVISVAYFFARMEVDLLLTDGEAGVAFAALDRRRGQNLRLTLMQARRHPALALISARIQDVSRQWERATPEERPGLAHLRDAMMASLTDRLRLLEEGRWG